MDEAVVVLANHYIGLLAWFITGIPSPFMREAYSIKADIEIVLRKLTATQLTGVELAQCAKDKYRRDSSYQERPICSST